MASDDASEPGREEARMGNFSRRLLEHLHLRLHPGRNRLALPADGAEHGNPPAGRRRRGRDDGARLGRGSHRAQQPAATLVGDPLLPDARLRRAVPDDLPGFGSNAMFLGWTQIKEYEEEMARAEERYGPIFEQYAALPVEQVAADPRALRIGERLFASYCAVCHGSDAGGVRGFPNCATIPGSGAANPTRSGPASSRAAPGSCRDGGTPSAGMPGWTRRSPTCARSPGARWMRRRPRPGRRSTTPCAWPATPRTAQANPPSGHRASPMTCGSTEARMRMCATASPWVARPDAGPREFLGEARVHVLAAWVWSLSNR